MLIGKEEKYMAEDCCSTGTRLLYACSGASDVGEIADGVARRLRGEGFAMMTCLAGIGADLSGFVESARGVDANITVDGCPIACARKNLERIGITPQSYILSDFGLEKGKTPVSVEIIEKVFRAIMDGEPVPSAERAPGDSGDCC